MPDRIGAGLELEAVCDRCRADNGFDTGAFLDLVKLVAGQPGENLPNARGPADHHGVDLGGIFQTEVLAQVALALKRIVGQHFPDLPHGFAPDGSLNLYSGTNGGAVAAAAFQSKLHPTACGGKSVVAKQGAGIALTIYIKVEVAIVVVISQCDACNVAARATRDDGKMEGAVAFVAKQARTVGLVFRQKHVQVAVVVHVAPNIGQIRFDRGKNCVEFEVSAITVVAVEACFGTAVVGQANVKIPVVVVVDKIVDLTVLWLHKGEAGEPFQLENARFFEQVFIVKIGSGRSGRAAADEQVEVAVLVIVGPGGDGIRSGLVGEFVAGDGRKHASRLLQEQFAVEGAAWMETTAGVYIKQVQQAIVVYIRQGTVPAGVAIDAWQLGVIGGKGIVARIQEQTRLDGGDGTIHVAVVVEVAPRSAQGDLFVADARQVWQLGEIAVAVIEEQKPGAYKQVGVMVPVQVHPGKSFVSGVGVGKIGHRIGGVGDSFKSLCLTGEGSGKAKK